jgi:hypothetical protein
VFQRSHSPNSLAFSVLRSIADSYGVISLAELIQDFIGAVTVSLWDLLTALCCAMPVAGALASAILERAGFSGYAITIAVGLALGLGCAYIMRAVGKTIDTHLKQNSTATRESYLRMLYLAAIVWIVLALFLGAWVSSVLLRLCTFCASMLSFSASTLTAV